MDINAKTTLPMSDGHVRREKESFISSLCVHIVRSRKAMPARPMIRPIEETNARIENGFIVLGTNR
jgi:hypothetical protein